MHNYSIILAVVFICIGVLLFSAFALFDVLIVKDDMPPLELEVTRALRYPVLLLSATFIAGSTWIGQAWQARDTRDELRRIGVSFIGLYIVILAIVMPQFGPSKTYAPQGEWIRNEIGPDESNIGMVYAGSFGIRKRGAFGYETGGAMVDLLDSAEQVEVFFSQHPNSLVLVQEKSVVTIFAGNEAAWRDRVQRELWVGKTLYLVVRSSPTE